MVWLHSIGGTVQIRFMHAASNSCTQLVVQGWLPLIWLLVSLYLVTVMACN